MAQTREPDEKSFVFQVVGLVLLLLGVALAGRTLLARESTRGLSASGGDAASLGGPSLSEAPAAEPTDQPVETSEIFAEKDPFNAPISRPATGSKRQDAKDSAGAPEGDFPPAPADDPGDPVEVLSVADGSARIALDGTPHAVTEGEIFAERFQLLAAGGRCATLLYGDDQFSLCEGQEILR